MGMKVLPTAWDRKVRGLPPPKKRASKRVPRETEADIQIKVVQYLIDRNVQVVHVPNEDVTGMRTFAQWKFLEKMGTLKGMPDLLIFHDPPLRPEVFVVGIELKRSRAEEATPEQLDFLRWLNGKKQIGEVCYGFEHTMEFLHSLGW